MLLAGFILLFGPNSAFPKDSSVISDTIYINTDYTKEDNSRLNCELNGAWSSEYSYYWIPGQPYNLQNLPDFVKSVQFKMVIYAILISNIFG